MSEERKPWAFVTHRGNEFTGVIAADISDTARDRDEVKRWTRKVAKFCGNALVRGSLVTPVYDRAEYEALLASLK